jgi:ribonuclease P protein component
MISDERFRKNEHLLKSKDFSKVYKKGTYARGQDIVLYCVENNLKHNRLGFSIGSKNIKRATSRNRIRRLFREFYRKSRPSLKNGFDIVLVVRRDLSKELTYDFAGDIFRKLATQTRLMV